MNITLRQMRLFLALAETGSVTAAARAMHVLWWGCMCVATE